MFEDVLRLGGEPGNEELERGWEGSHLENHGEACYRVGFGSFQPRRVAAHGVAEKDPGGETGDQLENALCYNGFSPFC